MREPSVRHSEPPTRQPTPAPMVERAFQLLGLLATSETGYSLSELARMLEMSKGSAHGLLKTLEVAHAVEVDENHRYTLGPRIYDLAQAYISRGGLRRATLPAMWRLASLSGETVFLGQVEASGVRIIERVDAPAEDSALRVSARRGTRIHLLAGATGRVALANWPAARREDYLRTRTLPRFTERSITDREAYLAAVEETAHTGIGEDHEEYLAGVNAVAAAIQGLGSELIALVWIVGFSSRFTGEVFRQAGEALRNETVAISHALGAN